MFSFGCFGTWIVMFSCLIFVVVKCIYIWVLSVMDSIGFVTYFSPGFPFSSLPNLCCEKQVEVYTCMRWQHWKPHINSVHTHAAESKNHVFYYGKRFTFLYKTQHIFQLHIFYNLTKTSQSSKTSNIILRSSLCVTKPFCDRNHDLMSLSREKTNKKKNIWM